MSHSTSELKSVFGHALDLASPIERARYLDEACNGSVGMRREVEELIHAVAQAGDFLSPATLHEHEVEISEPLGTVIGNYKILQQIGVGGMGLVYMAEQQQPVRRQVALKIIKPGMDSRQVIARFEAEWQALAMMDHANVAKVLDAGTTKTGCPYFVMELVKGITITKYCDEARLTVRERLRLFVSVCQALQHAHQKGIIHRDIKPTNVLVAMYDGVPVAKVIDFGVAKATGQRLTEKTMFTGFGQLIGTLEYMSPEQACFNALDVDTRSDIYSLGVLLYELLTDTTPLERSRLRTAAFDETLRMIRDEEPPKPSTRLSAVGSLPTIAANRSVEPAKLHRLVSGDLDWIVMKAMEKDRNRRYETASALAADVMRYLNDEPVQACPPTLHYRAAKFVRRNKTSVLASILVLLALVGGIIGTTWQMNLARTAQARLVIEVADKEAALRTARRSERDAKDQLFLALLNQARAGRFSRQIGQRLDSLAALAHAARIRPDERLRDEAIAAMALPDIRAVPASCSWPAGTTTACFDADYRLYARSDARGISIRRTADDSEIRRIESGAVGSGPVVGHLYFSPDDRYLFALGPGYRLALYRVADGQNVIQGEFRGCWAHAFTPDGRYLAVGQKENVYCFDLSSGMKVNSWKMAGPVHSLAFHPHSTQLAIGQSQANVVTIYDALAGQQLQDLPVGAMRKQEVAWHPDGRRLAISEADPRIQIWDVVARRKTATLDGHVHLVHTLTFHPDGSLLASHSWDGTLRLWDTDTGRPLLKLPTDVRSRPRFSRDGRWLTSSMRGTRFELLEVTPSREYRTLVSRQGLSSGGGTRADISSDGRLLAVGNADGVEPSPSLWDLRGGRELVVLPAGTGPVFFDRAQSPLPDQEMSQLSMDPSGETSASQRYNLLTSGRHGLQRWPITARDASRTSTQFQLGPPQQLSPLQRAWFNRTADGETLAAVMKLGGENQIVDVKTGAIRKTIGSHPNGEIQALSPNGQWAATCGWHSPSLRVWRIETGEMVKEWTVGRAFAFFTPDSRKLIISQSNAFSFWDLSTMKPNLRLPREMAQDPGYVAFSPDGELMAVEMAPGFMHVKELATGRTVATLEDPHGDRAAWQGFTSDGSQLVTVSNVTNVIHVWDLHAMRTHLKEMNLDWQWPEFRPALPETSSEPDTFTVDVVLGEAEKKRLSEVNVP